MKDEDKNNEIIGYQFRQNDETIREGVEPKDAYNKHIDPYKIVTETQPITFENAKWAYILGCAVACYQALKK